MTLKDLVPTFGKKKVPVRYDYDPLSLFREDMDRLVDNFFRGFDIEPFGSRFGSFSPDVEVSENDKELKISAELPGIDENDVDVSLSDNVLTISGEKKEEKESNGKDYFMKERSYGSFKRTIPLHTEIDTKKAEAHFKKGVLTIKLPKTHKEIEKKEKIAVKAE